MSRRKSGREQPCQQSFLHRFSVLRPRGFGLCVLCGSSSRPLRLALTAKTAYSSFSSLNSRMARYIPSQRFWLRKSSGRKRAVFARFRFIPQKVNRAPNWNCRGVFTVFVICPKFAELGGVDEFTNVMLGTFGYPNCALLERL